MKRKISSFQALKSLLLAGLLAAPMLAFNARAQNTDSHWSPVTDVFPDGNGGFYAYFADPLNWDSGVVPEYTNAAGGSVRVMLNQTVGSYVTCVITNDTHLYQLMAGAGGGGDVIITNGRLRNGRVGPARVGRRWWFWQYLDWSWFPEWPFDFDYWARLSFHDRRPSLGG